MFDFKAYQKFTDTTATYPGANKDDSKELTYLALGLAGETGETVDHIKKWMRSNFEKPIDVPKIKLELGDILYYYSRILKCLNLTIEEVAQANIDKLQDRQKNGTLHNR